MPVYQLDERLVFPPVEHAEDGLLAVGGDLSPYVLSCGLAGMLAFVGFDLARAGRRERELLAERRTVVSRLERHVSFSQPADAANVPE